jgi:hypothetical protein
MERGISIHVGVNHAATMRAYPLSLSEDTAWKMAELAFQAGYRAIHLLCGPEATREAVGAQLAGAARALRPGQTLFVSFSGHGSRVPDSDGDEWDHWDETWCLHDADLVDDELAACWRLLPAGARVLVVAESCFGAGSGRHGKQAMARHEAREAAPDPPVYRSAGPGPWRSVKQAAPPSSPCIERAPEHDDGIRASLLMLAGAREDRHAREGVYARHLLEVWSGGRFGGSFCDLHREVCRRVWCDGQEQDPRILMLGAPDLAFPLQTAFNLDRPVMRGPVTRGAAMRGPAMRGRGGGF